MDILVQIILLTIFSTYIISSIDETIDKKIQDYLDKNNSYNEYDTSYEDKEINSYLDDWD